MLFKKKMTRTIDPTREDFLPVATKERALPEIPPDNEFVPATVSEPQAEAPAEEADHVQSDLLLKIKSDIHRRVISQIDLSRLGTMEDTELRVEIRTVA